jgi:trigger factor
MQSSFKLLPKSKVEFTIEATSKDLEPVYQKLIKDLQKEVQVDGFRSGKIPEDFLIEKIGEEAFVEELINQATKNFLFQAAEKENLKPIENIDLDIKSENPLKFTAIFSYFPKVELGDYINKINKTKLKERELKVESQEIDEIIENIKLNNSTTKVIFNKTAQKGHRVKVDFLNFNSKQFDNKNVVFTLGHKNNNFIKGLEEEVIGMQVGEEKDHITKYDDNYSIENLAGKDVKIKIKLHQIEELILPELNDELAKAVSNGRINSWSRIPKDIRNYLLQEKERKEHNRLENELINQLTKKIDFEIPETFIKEQSKTLKKELKKKLAQENIFWKKFLEISKESEENAQKILEKESEEQIKKFLIIDELFKAEKIKVPKHEIIIIIEIIKKSLPKNRIAEFNQKFKDGGEEFENLQHRMKMDKLLNTILKKLNIPLTRLNP